jgi:Cys-tRNA(Pro)/Cys-tRNA(Cys) deacylase
MTPAVNAARKAKIVFRTHAYDHDPSVTAYGEEAAAKLGIDRERMFKTLVAALNDNEFVVALVAVAHQLDLKSLAEALEAKKSKMAGANDAQRATGYLLGAISPLGQKKKLRCVIDSHALAYETIFVSAGRRGLQIELSPADLAALVGGRFAPIAQS